MIFDEIVRNELNFAIFEAEKKHEFQQIIIITWGIITWGW